MDDRRQEKKTFLQKLLERLPKRGYVYTRAEDPRMAIISGLEGLEEETHPDQLVHLSSFVSLSIIFLLALTFVAWGFLLYYTVGAKWPPPWSFGEVQDLPGASVYSTETGKRLLGTGPRRLQDIPPQPQHVEEKPRSRALRGPGG
jgi:hypothetical protein